MISRKSQPFERIQSQSIAHLLLQVYSRQIKLVTETSHVEAVSLGFRVKI